VNVVSSKGYLVVFTIAQTAVSIRRDQEMAVYGRENKMEERT
jgi:hypothetical protein